MSEFQGKLVGRQLNWPYSNGAVKQVIVDLFLKMLKTNIKAGSFFEQSQCAASATLLKPNMAQEKH